MKRKNRVQKASEYEEKYGEIPKSYEERMAWMVDKYNLSEKKMDDIINKRNFMLQTLQFYDLFIVLYEEPEPTPRPRFRLINRTNFSKEAMNNGNFVHVYSINAKEDSMYMKRMIDNDLIELDRLIYTPCVVEYNTYQKTPSVFNIDELFLSEMGMIRPINRYDWDNLGKKYSDMSNHNIWIDDTLVISGTVNKFYSILPRVEIKLKYLNNLYNKYQYNSMIKKVDGEDLHYIKFV